MSGPAKETGKVTQVVLAALAAMILMYGYSRAVELVLRGRDWRYVAGWFAGAWVVVLVVAAAAGATRAKPWEVVLLIVASLGTLTAWAAMGAWRVGRHRPARGR